VWYVATGIMLLGLLKRQEGGWVPAAWLLASATDGLRRRMAVSHWQWKLKPLVRPLHCNMKF
jgi:hypothetical protein